MALSYGFFNSYGDDRLYDATDFSRYLEGLVTNGCLPNDTGFLAVVSGEQIQSNPPSVKISQGKAYYDGMWIYNDADLVFYMYNNSTGALGGSQQTDPNMYHLLYFVFDTNATEAGRKAYIKCTTGADPQLPSDGNGLYHMPLAKVADNRGTQVVTGDIEDLRPYAGVSGTGITTASLVDGCVTTDKVLNGTLLGTDINASAGILGSQLSTTAGIAVTQIANGAIGLKHLNGSIITGGLSIGSVTYQGAASQWVDVPGSNINIPATTVNAYACINYQCTAVKGDNIGPWNTHFRVWNITGGYEVCRASTVTISNTHIYPCPIIHLTAINANSAATWKIQFMSEGQNTHTGTVFGYTLLMPRDG